MAPDRARDIRLTLCAAALLGFATPGATPAAQMDPAIAEQRRAMGIARSQARAAERRAAQLEREARAMRRAADRSRAEQAAAAAAIQAAEARIAAAQARMLIIDRLRLQQRARLAERQGPIVRLTAALQTMARRPAALALVQPGSIDDMIHVRSLLGTALPEIRRRTAGLRAEVERADALRRQADAAVADLRHEQEQFRIEQRALARLEADQRRQSQGLVDDAMSQQDRMIAMGEKARDIAGLIEELGEQSDIRTRLASLDGPRLRPALPGRAGLPAPSALSDMLQGVAKPPRYRLPVLGRIVSGMGELSESGVRARGITLATARNAQVVAPAAGRVSYAGPFRSYGGIVIIDHDDGWATLVTGLGRLHVRTGAQLIEGSPLGTVGGPTPRVTVELRHRGVPVDLLPIVGGQ
ncbi:peptidoglycan DD-metalloendopeptidase family protein [Rhizorhabdus sp.]|uniref:murein hydrolase activator EnvC family protein n=1 Tax=Rhizorhabdus sp. TaxID=1968843 RepID=UPI0025E3EEB2|nr:peptidoglycan DD-metalloendopeptidase family protein [Rhizorhabdus sp.]